MPRRKTTARWDLTPNGPLRSVRIDRKVVTSFWDQRLPFVVPRSALAAIDGVEAPTDASGFISAMSSPLLPLLRTHALQDGRLREVTFNALYREKHGGREYPLICTDYDGPLMITKKAYRTTKTRYLLSAIPRIVRRHLGLPSGWVLVVGDFKSCHPAIAFALTADPALGEDLATGDIHQVTGDWILAAASNWAATARRELGKAVNNAMLFGLTERGIAACIQRALGVPIDGAWATYVWHAWWSRYPLLAEYRNQAHAFVQYCGANDEALNILSPGGWRSHFSPAELRGAVAAGPGHGQGPEAAARSVFSAVFRGIESDLLRLTITHFHGTASEHEGKGVLPLYDGLYIGARTDRVNQVVQALEDAGRRAADELGIPDLRVVCSLPDGGLAAQTVMAEVVSAGQPDLAGSG